MQATISKWGNSLAVRLPRHVADQTKLAEGSTVELEVTPEGSVTITPVRRKVTLAELLEGHPAPDSSTGNQEVDWGGAKGDEAW